MRIVLDTDELVSAGADKTFAAADFVCNTTLVQDANIKLIHRSEGVCYRSRLNDRITRNDAGKIA